MFSIIGLGLDLVVLTGLGVIFLSCCVLLLKMVKTYQKPHLYAKSSKSPFCVCEFHLERVLISEDIKLASQLMNLLGN